VTDPVLILTGSPGSGKTTTARIVVERFERAVHVESDVFYYWIRAGFVLPWKPEARAQNASVIRIIASVAAGYTREGYFTVVDGIVLPRWFLPPLRDALHAAGHRVAYAVLRAPLDVCAARAADRAEHPLGDADAVERMWSQFSDLGEFEPHAIETAAASPGEVADVIVRRLRDGALDI
jgi:predicted kinase